MNRWEPWNGVRAVREGVVDAVQVIYTFSIRIRRMSCFPRAGRKMWRFIARVPFDEGSLTGSLTVDSKWPAGDWRNTYFRGGEFEGYGGEGRRAEEGAARGISLAEMALRFILNNKDVSTIIPGMRKIANVESNLAASDRGPLARPLHAELQKHGWDRTPTKWFAVKSSRLTTRRFVLGRARLGLKQRSACSRRSSSSSVRSLRVVWEFSSAIARAARTATFWVSMVGGDVGYGAHFFVDVGG